MSKKLSEMTLEELWRLFPIFLTDHDPRWSVWYDEEIGALRGLLPFDTEFYHIGSTAISWIMAKPIIDIIIAVNTFADAERAADVLQDNGYILMSRSSTRISLNKGYTENGFAERVFHLHIRSKTDIDEVYFRDYLNAHSDIAREYERLKLSLWKRYEHDRDGYTAAKTDFVKRYTDLAKKISKTKTDR